MAVSVGQLFGGVCISGIVEEQTAEDYCYKPNTIEPNRMDNYETSEYGEDVYLHYGDCEEGTKGLQTFTFFRGVTQRFGEVGGSFCHLEIAFQDDEYNPHYYKYYGELICDDGLSPIEINGEMQCEECFPSLSDGLQLISNSICDSGTFDPDVYKSITSIPKSSCSLCIGELLSDGDDSSSTGDDSSSTGDDSSSTGDDSSSTGDGVIIERSINLFCDDGAPKLELNDIYTCDRSCEQVNYITSIDGSCIDYNCPSFEPSDGYIQISVSECDNFDKSLYSATRLYEKVGCDSFCIAELLLSENLDDSIDVDNYSSDIIDPGSNYFDDNSTLKKAPEPSEGTGGNSLTDVMHDLGDKVSENTTSINDNTKAIINNTNSANSNTNSLNLNSDALNSNVNSLNNLKSSVDDLNATLNGKEFNGESSFDIDEFSTFISNASDSISSVKTQFDDTQSLIKNGFSSNVISASNECPFSMGTRTTESTFDICSYLSPFKSLFALIISSSILAYSIRIMFWGLK